jgi:hypothetical protein
MRFEFAEGRLDRIEVGRIRWLYLSELKLEQQSEARNESAAGPALAGGRL